jgi:hypothetical protein
VSANNRIFFFIPADGSYRAASDTISAPGAFIFMKNYTSALSGGQCTKLAGFRTAWFCAGLTDCNKKFTGKSAGCSYIDGGTVNREIS